MNEPLPAVLKITGEVAQALRLSFDDLAKMDAAQQVLDVSRLDPRRKGDAVRLAGLLQRAGCKPTAFFLGLHSSTDNFHASIPLAPVAEQALVIYRLDDHPLPARAGGPYRFFIPDPAACHTHEIDECASVKFVDHIELTRSKGFDNRPQDDTQHEALHRGAN